MSKAEEFLEHSGIVGMKWGRRRYQNPDGTLTEEGKKRYAKSNSERKEENKEPEKEPKYHSGTDKYGMRARHLTDEELRKRTNRLTAENNYKKALRENRENDKSPRQKAIKKIFSDSAVTAASNVMGNVYTKAATAFIEGKFPELMGKPKNK